MAFWSQTGNWHVVYRMIHSCATAPDVSNALKLFNVEEIQSAK